MSAPANCPVCHAPSSGKFCSECGAPMAGAACVACDAPLTPGAKFCHRCGTQVGAPPPADDRGLNSALPWAVAAIALVALIALVAAQRFSHRPAEAPAITADQTLPSGPDATPGQAGAPMVAPGRAPDISNMSPEERASRLFDRVMTYAQAGKTDSVQMFSPMAIAAYEMLGTLNMDQHYDLGRIGLASGDVAMATAQADTILATNPSHLLGLILATAIARKTGNTAQVSALTKRFVAAAPAERSRAVPEYIEHQNDIESALANARKQNP